MSETILVGIDGTEENRRAYRSLLLETRGLGDYISGVILFEETLGQKNSVPNYSNDSKNQKKFGVSTAVKAFGAKNTAALVGYNLQMNYSTNAKIFWSVFFIHLRFYV